ncbi:unnamed protein product [Notodromas monacha]|uniref:Uncharacterized protein n=1 Tax=Notodromas monacha TaxID=399045 RepID=A0A7R9GAL5_9CRUS|nr:unnamed protein product [Notodromas monacha]CAG0914150.1 unnamed protein product [Notodromas monacha]
MSTTPQSRENGGESHNAEATGSNGSGSKPTRRNNNIWGSAVVPAAKPEWPEEAAVVAPTPVEPVALESSYLNAEALAARWQELNHVQAQMAYMQQLQLHQAAVQKQDGRQLDTTNVYVAHLPATFGQQDFVDLMSRFGTVVSSRLLAGEHWKKKGVRGVAFARMATPEEAAAAIKGVNNLSLPGSTMPLRARYAFKTQRENEEFGAAQVETAALGSAGTVAAYAGLAALSTYADPYAIPTASYAAPFDPYYDGDWQAYAAYATYANPQAYYATTAGGSSTRRRSGDGRGSPGTSRGSRSARGTMPSRTLMGHEQEKKSTRAVDMGVLHRVVVIVVGKMNAAAEEVKNVGRLASAESVATLRPATNEWQMTVEHRGGLLVLDQCGSAEVVSIVFPWCHAFMEREDATSTDKPPTDESLIAEELLGKEGSMDPLEHDVVLAGEGLEDAEDSLDDMPGSIPDNQNPSGEPTEPVKDDEDPAELDDASNADDSPEVVNLDDNELDEADEEIESENDELVEEDDSSKSDIECMDISSPKDADEVFSDSKDMGDRSSVGDPEVCDISQEDSENDDDAEGNDDEKNAVNSVNDASIIEEDDDDIIVEQEVKSAPKVPGKNEETTKKPHVSSKELTIVDVSSLLPKTDPKATRVTPEMAKTVVAEKLMGKPKPPKTSKTSLLNTVLSDGYQLGDKDFVLETASFVCPYVYQKPLSKPVVEVWRELRKKHAEESGETLDDEEEDELFKSEAKKPVDGKKKKQKTRKRGYSDADEAWSGASESDSESDSEKSKKDPFFSDPIGSFLLNIGKSIVDEFANYDLLRMQKRKLAKDGGASAPAAAHKVIQMTKTALENSKNKNIPYKLAYKRCRFCNFRTTSSTVLARHYEVPHPGSGNLAYCNFCNFSSRVSLEMEDHFRIMHKRRYRVPRPDIRFKCPLCPWEDRFKVRFARHMEACEKKFVPEKTLEITDWEPPAKAPLRQLLQGGKTDLNSARMSYQFHPLVTREHVKVANMILASASKPPRPQRNYSLPNPPNPVIPRGPSMPSPNLSMLMNQGLRGPRPDLMQLTRLMWQQQQQNPGTNMSWLNNLQANGQGVAVAGGTSISLVPSSGRKSGGISVRPNISNMNSGPRASNGTHKNHPGSMPFNLPSSLTIQSLKGNVQQNPKPQPQTRAAAKPLSKGNLPPGPSPSVSITPLPASAGRRQGMPPVVQVGAGPGRRAAGIPPNRFAGDEQNPTVMYQWKLLAHVTKDHKMNLKPAHLSYKCTVCTATFSMYRSFEQHVYLEHTTLTRRQGGAVIPRKHPARVPGLPGSLNISDEITIIPQPKTIVGNKRPAPTRPITIDLSDEEEPPAKAKSGAKACVVAEAVDS